MYRQSRPLVTVVLCIVLFVIADVVLRVTQDGAQVTSGNSPGSPTPASDSSVEFGLADPGLLSETAKAQAFQLRQMRAIGIRSVRFDANWYSVQPTGPRVFHWGVLDQAVRSARTAGMSVDLI